MNRYNRDLLNSVGVRTASVTTTAILDAIQDQSPEAQMVAVTAAYKLMIERFDIPPQDLMTVTDNVMNHADGRRVEFLAAQDYMAGEL